VLLRLQARDSDPGLHGPRLLVAALLGNHSRGLAPARTLRQEAEILQAGAYMHEMQGKGWQLLRRVNENRIRAKQTPEEGSLSVWSQTVEVRRKYSGRTWGSDSGGLVLLVKELGVRKLVLRPIGLGWRSEDCDSDLSVRVGGPLAST
jgi:hypothetical protein